LPAHRIPNIWSRFTAVYTPTVPVTRLRPARRPISGRGPARRGAGLDRFEVRRRNLIGNDQFPWTREASCRRPPRQPQQRLDMITAELRPTISPPNGRAR
jgi:CO/xanthine dehydrogenase Mo-binding subunit